VSANSNLPKAEESIANISYAIDGPPKILVVDDDDDIRLLMVQLLRSEGYRVTEASTAGEAESNALKNHPHLILMDLSMPGTDGLSSIWNIRKQPGMATVPIIIVSAYDAFDLRAEATAAGCCGYLTKPLDPDQLKTMIRSVMESTY
jgi:CheY-like chemotaxis protein